jgi:radical SAM superfamily enzyme YgiQ (UPF0313 family)
VDENRTLKFCDLLERSGLRIHFRIDIRAGASVKALRRLREVGCEVVGFGVESGSDRILQRIQKGTTRRGILSTIRTCKELGYWTIGFFMISLPEETLQDIQQTFALFEFFDQLNVQISKIHPNTRLYNELKQRGEISDEVWFDPSFGLHSEYGNEVYYCKDFFPSAAFSMDQLRLMSELGTYRYQSVNPLRAVQRRGLARGLLSVCLSSILYALLSFKRTRRLYLRLRRLASHWLVLLAIRGLGQ